MLRRTNSDPLEPPNHRCIHIDGRATTDCTLPHEHTYSEEDFGHVRVTNALVTACSVKSCLREVPSQARLLEMRT